MSNLEHFGYFGISPIRRPRVASIQAPSRKQQPFIHLNMHVSAFKGRFGSESDVGELRILDVFFLLGSSGLYFALHVGSDANNVVG